MKVLLRHRVDYKIMENTKDNGVVKSLQRKCKPLEISAVNEYANQDYTCEIERQSIEVASLNLGCDSNLS